MINQLKPKHQYVFGDICVLWYEKCNTYSVITKDFQQLLNIYFDAAATFSAFYANLPDKSTIEEAQLVFKQLNDYVLSCNTNSDVVASYASEFKRSSHSIITYYTIYDKKICIYYSSPLVAQLVHPALVHLESSESKEINVTFDIYIENNKLCLYKNEQLLIAVNRREYHRVQGKLIFEILNSIHDTTTSDWVGTFHGSAISDGHNAILFVGHSGKGKSTLSGLLALNGFELLADDVSAMRETNGHIYHNPLALSIKAGAFGVLKPYVADFETLPTTHFNTSKGVIKHIPFTNPKKKHYPCPTVIMVNYKAQADTTLNPLSVKDLLEVLIPESWLSPNASHAQQFLEWLSRVTIYKLTYSDTASAIATVSNLFKDLRSKK